MNILEKIVSKKKVEVAQAKEKVSLKQLEDSELFSRPVNSLEHLLRTKNGYGIIAEFKRKSPSKGIINAGAKVEEIVPGYIRAGASAASILTDNAFFGGTLEDLRKARSSTDRTLLRKEFIIDKYQIAESKSLGADIILLIAAVLTAKEINEYASYAKMLNMEILLELHDESELDKVSEQVTFLGINNRNLKTFEVDLQQSVRMARKMPKDFIKVSESGLRTAEDIILLRKYGFQAFLIGENFMAHEDPVLACQEFIKELPII